MKSLLIFAALCVVSAVTAADEPEASASKEPVSNAPIANISSAQKDEPSADGNPPARFTTEGKGETAGYKNDEIVYPIIVTSHDSRVIRCTASLQGSYYENGQKQSV